MQKHVTLNEALTRLDALVQTVVVSRSVAAQPSEAQDGDLYLLPAGASGPDWTGRPAGTLMRHEAGGWSPIPAPDGLIIQVRDADEIVLLEGGEIVPVGARLGPLQHLTLLGLGTTADAANPFAAKLNKALWAARETGEGGDGDLRFTFNKQAAGDVLSLLFQTGFGGRAELGLIGDDDLRLKVSADGAAWRDALTVERVSGRVVFARGAVRHEIEVFEEDGDYVVPAWARSLTVMALGGGGGGGAGGFGASGDRFGGGGGGAGGVGRVVLPADALSGTLNVAVGAGGAGGAAADGGAGTASGVTYYGNFLITAPGGAGGSRGSGVSGLGGQGGPGCPASNAGGASSVIADAGVGQALQRPDGPGGGGAGGGVSAAGVAQAGGAGGAGAVLSKTATGGAGGVGGAGSPGSGAPWLAVSRSGGGGGGGAAAASGAGHGGAAAGLFGAGGGGGGAGVVAGGPGGAGAAGVVWLIAEG